MQLKADMSSWVAPISAAANGFVAWIVVRLGCLVQGGCRATRTETGFVVRIIVFSITTAMAVSACCAGGLRAHSLGPIRRLYRAMAVPA